MSRKGHQFTSVPLICPKCGHVLGEQAFFQSFEARVAAWLSAKTAPTSTKSYDVYDSEFFPGMTFQVKYSHENHKPAYRGRIPQRYWIWLMKRMDSPSPDFFILFGIEDDGTENCFLLSRADFIDYSVLMKQNGRDQHILRVSSKRKSDRLYNYVPKIWRHVVLDPESNLPDAIRSYVPGKHSVSMYMSFYLQHQDEIVALHESGISMEEIGRRFKTSYATIRRVLRGGRR